MDKKKEGKSVKISLFFRVVILLFALATVLVFFFGGNHPYINGTGLLLIELFFLLLFIFSGELSEKCPPLLLVIFLLTLFFVTRIFVYMLFPESFFGNIYTEYTMFNAMLLYVLLGALVVLVGVLIGYSLIEKKVDFTNIKNNTNLTVLGWFALFVIIFELVVFFVFGHVGSTGSGAHLGFFQRYLARLFNPLIAVLIFWTAYTLSSKKSKSEKRLFFAVIIFYFLSFFLSGSRAGVFEIIMLFLAATLFLKGNLRITLKTRYVLLAILLIPFLLLGHVAATELRDVQWTLEESTLEEVTEAIFDVDIIDFDYKQTVLGVSRRLSLLEPLFYVMFPGEHGMNDVSEIVNWKTTTKSSVNRIVPGVIFQDVIFTEYAFGYLLSDEGIVFFTSSGNTNFVGYEWGMHGISYQLFGYGGGLVFLFLVSGLLGFLISLGYRRKTLFCACLGVFFVYVLHFWVRTFGIDNLVDRTFFGFMLMLVYLFVYKFFIVRRSLVL